jgi:SnoaL-like domain
MLNRKTKKPLEATMNIRTRISRCAVIALLCQSFFSPQVLAQDDDSAALTAIIDAVEKGWLEADGTPFRKHFLDFDGARYIESGGQNAGLTDLIEHHVEPEGDALDSFELNLSNVETHIEGDFAWAIADVEVKALVKSDQRQIHNRGYETFLFRRVDGNWRVVHTHSSSRPVTDEGGHEHSESDDD